MAFFQKGFFNPTNFKPPKIKQEGKKTKKALTKIIALGLRGFRQKPNTKKPSTQMMVVRLRCVRLHQKKQKPLTKVMVLRSKYFKLNSKKPLTKFMVLGLRYFTPKPNRKKNLIKSFKYLKFLKNKTGFASLLLLPLATVMITGLMGMFVLSQGIKSKTVAQSQCIQTNLKGQKELGVILTELLKLNKKSKKLHTKRLIVKASLMAALATGSFIIANQLRKKLKKIKQQQKLLIVKQKALLAKSRLVKIKTFKTVRQKLKKTHIKDLREKSFFNLALAIKKRKIGDKAYSYHPVPNFINHQKSRFIWKAKIPATPLDGGLKKILPYGFSFYGTYSCTASLKKGGQNGKAHFITKKNAKTPVFKI